MLVYIALGVRYMVTVDKLSFPGNFSKQDSAIYSLIAADGKCRSQAYRLRHFAVRSLS